MGVCHMILCVFILAVSSAAQSTNTCENPPIGYPVNVNPVLVCNANSSSPDGDGKLKKQLADLGGRITTLEKAVGAVSSSDRNCSMENKGLFRFQSNESILQVCDGAQWQTVLTTVSLQKRGTNRENAAASCQEIYATGQSKSATYWINPDPSFYSPVRVFCEMQFNGGGWMRVYNMMAKPAGVQYAQSMYEAITRNAPIRIVHSNETTHAVHTKGLRLELYREVAYGWSKSAEDIVSHYGYYKKSSGIKGDCYVDDFCGNGKTIATMTSSPTGTSRSYVAPSDPTYPHVGVAWSRHQVVWGYDKDTAPYGNWANWQDTACCLAAAGKDIQEAGMNWRYSILIR